MNILRRTVSWISLYLVAGLFFLTANAFVFFGVINASNVKQALSEEGAYEKVVPSVLSSATYSDNKASQLPLENPLVREAAMKAFPASDLEQKGSTLVDGVFGWLEGKTETPQYRLDFSANKQNLAAEVGNSAEERLSSLPRCGPGNIPSSVDAFSIDCLPFGLSAKTVADRASAQISNDQGFLKDPVISSDNLASASGGTVADNPFEQLEGLKPFYENKGLLLWLLPVLTVLAATLGLFLATDRPRGLKRLASSFLSGAVGLAIFAVIIVIGFENALRTVARDTVTRDIASPVLISLAQQARTVYLIFAGVGLVTTIILFVVRRKLPVAR